ncbi:hypothetical protein [Neisseria wadsworthii]|uniref:Lipoprotein n=1 Tax=Neisseria wadsworthii 9715 TaxID=1030841 RepID=G4CSL0_9NEIS|nr:hypothetical protein [Neisseria wadsworthii]EGZ44656.1 hypothetical protein HMPREF9370_2070 [Neisseria wadsworthii 9715]
MKTTALLLLLSLSLPACADFDNLFQPDAQYHSCFYNRKADKIYLFARNSDGAGSYNALLIFTKGRYIKRLIDDSQS